MKNSIAKQLSNLIAKDNFDAIITLAAAVATEERIVDAMQSSYIFADGSMLDHKGYSRHQNVCIGLDKVTYELDEVETAA